MDGVTSRPSDGAPAQASLGPLLEGAGDSQAGVSPSGDPTAAAEPAIAPRPFSWKRFFWTISPLSLIGVLIALEVPLCPMKNFLGVPCPGCGLTRATEAMLTGDLASMVLFHPLAPIVTPLVVFSVLRVTLVSAGVLRTNNDPLGKLPAWFWSGMAIALVGLWITRMLGLFGGTPDPIDPSNGLLWRAARFVFYDAWMG